MSCLKISVSVGCSPGMLLFSPQKVLHIPTNSSLPLPSQKLSKQTEILPPSLTMQQVPPETQVGNAFPAPPPVSTGVIVGHPSTPSPGLRCPGVKAVQRGREAPSNPVAHFQPYWLMKPIAMTLMKYRKMGYSLNCQVCQK